MRRVLFAFGLSFMAAQSCAVILPRAVLLPAAFFMAGCFAVLAARRRVGYPCVVCLASALSLCLFWVQTGRFVLPVLKLAGEEYQLTARVESVRPSYAPGTVHAVLRVTQLDGQPADFKADCPMLPHSEPGEEVGGRFLLRSLPPDATRSARLADRVYLTADCTEGFARLGEASGPGVQLLRLRRALARSQSRYLPAPYDAVVAAMTLGDKSGLPWALRTLFRRAGLSHLLVVSGLHLTLLCGMFLQGDLFMSRWRRPRALASLLMVLLLMALTGFTPSVCRAGIMAIIFDVGLIFLLPSDGLTSLGASALWLCCFNCYASCDVGLQLSYAATMGVLFASSVIRRMRRALPEGAPRQKLWGIRAAEIVLVPLFASLSTLPVQLWHGLPVSGVAVVSNLLTLWLVKPLLYCGLAAALLGFATPLAFAQRVFALGAALLARLLVQLAGFCAALPGSNLVLPRGYSLFVLGLLFILGAVLWHRERLRWMWAAAPCFVLAAALCTGLLQRDVVTIQLVGDGYNPCAVIRQNQHTAVLFRGGQRNAYAVQRHLDEHNIQTIDLLADLRSQPKERFLSAGQYLALAELTAEEPVSCPLTGDVALTLLPQEEGNLALAEIGSYRAAMGSGKVQLPGTLPVDLTLAGPGELGGIQPEAVLLTSMKYSWLPETEGPRLLYSSGEPLVQIRPGRSCRYFEVSDESYRTGL